MNGLAILASPRANGKLAGMLDEAVKSAVAGGYAVDRINLYTQEKMCIRDRDEVYADGLF